MKRLVPFCISLLLAAPLFGAFEGSIDMKTTAGKHKGSITYHVKGHKIRMDVKFGKGTESYTIQDFKKMKSYAVFEKNKTVMENDLNKAANVAKKAHRKGQDKVRKTGKTRKILGYTCDQWVSEDKKSTTEMWMARKFTPFPAAKAFQTGKSQVSYDEKMFANGSFPLLVKSTRKNGKEVYRLEATRITKKTLSPSLFVVPKGYKNQGMPDLSEIMKKFPFKRK